MNNYLKLFRRQALILSAAPALLFSVSCLSMFVVPLYTDIEFASSQTGVKIEILGDGKVLRTAIAPAAFKMRTRAQLVFRFSKEGYRTQTIIASLATNSAKGTISTCLLGPFTLFFGTLFDFITGATQNIHPDFFNIKLEPVQTNNGAARRPLNLNVRIQRGANGEEQVAVRLY